MAKQRESSKTAPKVRFRDLQAVAETSFENSNLSVSMGYSPHIVVHIEGLDDWVNRFLEQEGIEPDPKDEDYWKARFRIERRLERIAIDNWLAEGDRTGIDISEEPRMSFRRKAGCSCGCSPAWIDATMGNRSRLRTQYVTVNAFIYLPVTEI